MNLFFEYEIQSLSGDNYQSQIQSFENEFFKIIGKAKSFINIASNNSAQNSASAVRFNQPYNTCNSDIKLPVMELPTFHGEYNNWIAFRDKFKALIGDNVKVKNVRKLEYLQMCVKGEAAKIIDLDCTSDNYSIAWELLKKRYDNRRIIIQRYVKNILDLPAMSKNRPVILKQS